MELLDLVPVRLYFHFIFDVIVTGVCRMKNAIGLLLMVALSAVGADYNLGVGIADVTGPIAGITLVNLFAIFSHYL